MVSIHNLRTWADSAILVDNRSLDGRARTDADWQLVALGGFQIAGRLIEVGPHHHGVANRHVAANVAAEPDHAVLDPRAGLDHAPVGH